MVNVQPKNSKLVDRARRIIAGATGLSYDKAGDALHGVADSDVKTAIVMVAVGLFARRSAQRVWLRPEGISDRL